MSERRLTEVGKGLEELRDKWSKTRLTERENSG